MESEDRRRGVAFFLVRGVRIAALVVALLLAVSFGLALLQPERASVLKAWWR